MSTDYVIYRHYDDQNNLLYVGRSDNALKRTQQHNDTAHWFKQVTKILCTHVISYSDMVKLEIELIQKEKPRYNSVHNVGKTFQAFLSKQKKHPLLVEASRNFPDVQDSEQLRIVSANYDAYTYGLLQRAWDRYRASQNQRKRAAVKGELRGQ